MSQKVELNISFNSWETIALIKAISQSLKPFNSRLPNIVTDGFDEDTNTQDWIEQLIPKYERSVNAYWGDIFENEGFINYRPREQIVKIKISDYELIDAESVMKMLAPLPWTVAAFCRLSHQGGWKEYLGPSFGSFHFAHGWACAFKKEGHAQVVSDRWLEYGPWRFLRDEENDISFIQFHDLNADPATALEQAKPGHRAMSISGAGGYLVKPEPWSTFDNYLNAVYVPETYDLRVVIPAGKQITYREMSDYCVARNFLELDVLINTLSFIFIVAEEAQTYLHDLWLREIQCFGITPEGVEIRLDTNYNPVPNPPDWVRRLEESQAG